MVLQCHLSVDVNQFGMFEDIECVDMIRGGGHGDAGSCGTTLGVSLACLTIPDQVCRV